MMKSYKQFLIAATCLLAASAAFATNSVESVYLDAADGPNFETSRTLQIPLDHGRMKTVEFVFEFSGSPSNSLSVAVGEDSNRDGDLSLEEIAWECGYDSGEWTTKDTATGLVSSEPAATEGTLRKTISIRRKGFAPNWNLAKFIRRGHGAISETITYNEEYVRFIMSIR